MRRHHARSPRRVRATLQACAIATLRAGGNPTMCQRRAGIAMLRAGGSPVMCQRRAATAKLHRHRNQERALRATARPQVGIDRRRQDLGKAKGRSLGKRRPTGNRRPATVIRKWLAAAVQRAARRSLRLQISAWLAALCPHTSLSNLLSVPGYLQQRQRSRAGL